MASTSLFYGELTPWKVEVTEVSPLFIAAVRRRVQAVRLLVRSVKLSALASRRADSGEIMSLRTALEQELRQLAGLNSQQSTSVTLTDPGGIMLTIDFLAVDSMGCSFEQMVIDVPSMQGVAFDVLKKWAENLSRRITYLLENIAPLEFDETAGEALIRSTPPDQLPDGTQYYEILLQTLGAGRFSLKRFASIKGQPGRSQVPMTATHEVILKLADDLVAAIPSSP